ncbi:hypothetical protein [Goodfellowiella coeruleoviolacea]|uniref:hypothetical protein n=1 Tax=Goodfellowiella coeruleoviolacea TaxID=334858 RepID=UPI0020A3C7BB|nr:hypothetical protein [Goodfellowiella coeruleoviolacea]
MSSWLAADIDLWWFGPTDADVFAAWGQVLGAAFTLAAVLVALSVSVVDGRRWRAERRDQEVTQARLVLVDLTEARSFRLVITNHSASPVMHLTVENVQAWSGGVRSTRWVLPEWLYPGELWHQSVRIQEVMAPGDAISFKYNPEWPEVPDHPFPTAVSVTYSFTDAAGLRWRRTDYEEPERVLAQQTPRWFRRRRGQSSSGTQAGSAE